MFSALSSLDNLTVSSAGSPSSKDRDGNGCLSDASSNARRVRLSGARVRLTAPPQSRYPSRGAGSRKRRATLPSLKAWKYCSPESFIVQLSLVKKWMRRARAMQARPLLKGIKAAETTKGSMYATFRTRYWPQHDEQRALPIVSDYRSPVSSPVHRGPSSALFSSTPFTTIPRRRKSGDIIHQYIRPSIGRGNISSLAKSTCQARPNRLQ